MIKTKTYYFDAIFYNDFVLKDNSTLTQCKSMACFNPLFNRKSKVLTPHGTILNL